jgi:hypothetical protein
MAKTKSPGAEMEKAERRHPVVQLHEAGISYRRIAELTGISKSSAQRIYRDVLAEARGVKDIEHHLDKIFSDIEGSLDELRPWILQSDFEGEPKTHPPLTKDLWGAWWKALKAKRDFLGADAAARSQVTREEVVVGGPDDETAVYLARLAAWARRTNAINCSGFNPALPPGMTERVDPNANGHAASNGHGIYGRGMWSTVLENPSED